MQYTINGSTVFIKGNGIIGHYKVDGQEVYKLIEHHSGDLMVDKFHTLGDLPLNTEAQLLNELREAGKI